MNVLISMSAAEARESAEIAKEKYLAQLTTELDEIFKSKINTPDQIYNIHKKLEHYKSVTGVEYIKTIEENTIV